MYKQFYNMQKEPFGNYPFTDIFYKSSIHNDAWKYLARGIKKKEAVLFVTGEYGTGKTLLCLKLVKIFISKKNIPFIFLPTPNYNFKIVLKKIIKVLGISSDISSCISDESELLNIIYEYFEEIDNLHGKYIYIIIDEIQDISYSFANKLKLLISFNTSEHFPFKIILFGHMVFLKNLNEKNLKSLKQRIKNTFYLQPFNFNETKEYIYFRLIYSGASGTPVFDDSAIHAIQSASSGTPRLINNICDTCLMEASRKKINYINADLIENILKKNTVFENNEINIIENPETNGNYNTPESREANNNIKSIHGPGHETDESCSPYDHYEEKINKEFGKEKKSANGREDVLEDKNKKESIDLKSKSPINKKTGLILVLILLIMILSFILFVQMQSSSSTGSNISESKNKTGNNFIKNYDEIICYHGTNDFDINMYLQNVKIVI